MNFRDKTEAIVFFFNVATVESSYCKVFLLLWIEVASSLKFFFAFGQKRIRNFVLAVQKKRIANTRQYMKMYRRDGKKMSKNVDVE